MTPSPSADSVGLKPCPFCGGENLSVRYDADDPEYTFVQCDRCETQGPVVVSATPGTKESSIARWNSRPSAASPASEAGGADA
jgi:Lar family restriction alleviation protein